MQVLYVYSGSDSYWATTPDGTGASLPAEHGPWKKVKTVDAKDPRVEQGTGKGTLADIRMNGYSLRRITVTFEPITTVPVHR